MLSCAYLWHTRQPNKPARPEPNINRAPGIGTAFSPIALNSGNPSIASPARTLLLLGPASNTTRFLPWVPVRRLRFGPVGALGAGQKMSIRLIVVAAVANDCFALTLSQKHQKKSAQFHFKRGPYRHVPRVTDLVPAPAHLCPVALHCVW